MQRLTQTSHPGSFKVSQAAFDHSYWCLWQDQDLLWDEVNIGSITGMLVEFCRTNKLHSGNLTAHVPLLLGFTNFVIELVHFHW